jgi:hypothetical protein
MDAVRGECKVSGELRRVAFDVIGHDSSAKGTAHVAIVRGRRLYIPFLDR